MKKEIQPITNLKVLMRISDMNVMICKKINLSTEILLRNIDQAKKTIEYNRGLFNGKYYVVKKKFAEVIMFFSQMELKFWSKDKEAEDIFKINQPPRYFVKPVTIEKKLNRKQIDDPEDLIKSEGYAVKYPLHYAVIKYDITFVKEFLYKVENIDFFDNKYMNVPGYIMYLEKFKIEALFLKFGVKIDDEHGVALMNQILRKVKNIDLLDNKHIAALEYAIYLKKFEVSELLLKFGATKDLFNIDIGEEAHLYYQMAADEGLYKTACMLSSFKKSLKNVIVAERIGGEEKALKYTGSFDGLQHKCRC